MDSHRPGVTNFVHVGLVVEDLDETVGFLALLGFAAALQRVLREADESNAYWADLTASTGVASAVLILVGWGLAIVPATSSPGMSLAPRGGG